MILALESAVIAHGLPRPLNVKVAVELERMAKQMGCDPKTIGIVNGKIRVGMSTSEIREMGKRDDVLKVGTRDIPVAVALKRWGATTVSATMRIAHDMGIKVFATGGIGGVHPGNDWDVSQDILELAQTNMVVVSAGAKSILDLKRTMEALETFQVTVIGYKTEEFPAFYTRSSGIRIQRIDSLDEIVKMFRTKERFDIPGAILVCNPIPEEHEIPGDEFESWKEKALAEAREKGIEGKDLTPFLLKRIMELSNGKALEANISLLKNNVRLGCEIAKKMEV